MGGGGCIFLSRAPECPLMKPHFISLDPDSVFFIKIHES